MKRVALNIVHVAVMDGFKGVLQTYADDLSPIEMLALASQLVGNIIALQDQTKITPEMAMVLVGKNIEQGNATAITSILGTSAGEA